MTVARHTPYDGSSKPFTIGLSALEPTRWIEKADDIPAMLDEKARLLPDHFDEVFQAVAGSEAAQQECLDLLLEHLLTEHGDVYRRVGDTIEFAGRSIRLDQNQPPLFIAGQLVADDLAILEKKPDGWNLTAGYISFPSSWSLKEKAGLPMEGVHTHVPGFEGGTRNATMINRIFDNLQPNLPAERFNWSIYPEGELFWPPEKGARANTRPFVPSGNFIRVERQTLRRLPKTGGIVFTIRIYQDAFAAIRKREDAAVLEAGLAERVRQFTPEQLAYKGMVQKKQRLIAYLEGREG